MSPTPPRSFVLELARIDEPQDPHAFRFEPQGYTLRTPGGGRERFDIAWSRELLADLEAIRRPGCDARVVQAVGEQLRRALKPAGWDELGRRLHAASAEGPVIVTLRSSAAELYALPWELLTVGPSGQHLGELPGVLLCHEWPGTTTLAECPDPRPEGGRILVAWSAAGGGVPAAEHVRAIAEACSEGHVDFDMSHDVLANASVAGLADALAAAAAAGRPFAVLHLLCHGGLRGGDFGLVFDGADGAPALVDAGRLRQVLAPHADSVRLVVLAACDGGNVGDPGNYLGSVAQALHRARFAAVIASRYPLSVRGSVALTRTLYRALLVDLRSLEQAFLAARAALARDEQHLEWASLQLYAREDDGADTRPCVIRPYRGLLPFEAAHRRFFFGRDAELREVLGDLQALRDADAPRFLFVAGASGTGKSSLVLSSVVPELQRREPPWEAAIMRPGNRPLAALDAALAARRDGSRPFLLVVDQFEEVFTHGEPADRGSFVRRLWALASGATGIDCILTIRVDFLARCGELVLDDAGLCLDRIAYDEAHRVFVARTGRAQVRAAIVGPAEQVGLVFEPGLVDRILADVGDEPGALPLLQVALDRLWSCRVGRTLTAGAYAEFGGLVGALQNRADALIEALGPAERNAARRLLTRLVGIGDDEAVDTRRRVALAQLEPGADPAQAAFRTVLAQLVDARLVVRNEEEGAATVEIAHEALIRSWSRLRGWIAEDRVKLAALAQLTLWVVEWRTHGTLLTGAQLGYASELARRHHDDLDDATRGLVRASQARELRRRAALLGVLGLIATLAVIAVVLWRSSVASEARATDNARIAQDSARIAEDNAKAADAARARALLRARAARDGTRLAAARSLAADGRTALALGLLREVEAASPSAEILGWSASVLETLSKRGREVGTLQGHTGPVTAAAFSPDGGRIVTASDDSTARVWDARTHAPLAVLTGHEYDLVSAAFACAGACVVTTSQDGTARLWDANTGAPTTVLARNVRGEVVAGLSADGARVLVAEEDAARVLDVATQTERAVLRGLSLRATGSGPLAGAFSPDGARVILTYDERARIWDAATGAALRELKGHEGLVLSTAFSPDGLNVVTASTDATARVWDVITGKPLTVLAGHTDAVDSVAFSRDGTRLVTTSVDGTARLWSADASTRIAVIGSWAESIDTAAFSPDGADVITTGKDNTARMWDAKTGTPAALLQGHSGRVNAAVFSPDGVHVVTTSDDSTAKLWEVRSGAELAAFRGQHRLYDPAFSPDGSRILTALMDGTARVLDANTLAPLVVLTGHDAHVTAAKFSPDGARIVTVHSDNTAWIRDAIDGAPRFVLEHDDALQNVVDISPDGERIVTADGAVVRVWNLRTGQPLVASEGHDAAVTSAAFSRDGRRILITDDSGARVWEPDSGVERHAVGPVRAAAWSPDGTRFVTTPQGLGRAFSVHDANTGATVASFAAQPGVIMSVAFDPAGTRLVTGSSDRSVRVWDAQTGAVLVTLKGHQASVNAAIFSPDGARLATSDGSDVILWDLSTGRELATLHGKLPVFSPDGTRIVTLSDRTLRLTWAALAGDDLPPLRQLWRASPLCPSPEERARLLGEEPRTAERSSEACRQMIECIHRRPDPEFADCLAEFRASSTLVE